MSYTLRVHASHDELPIIAQWVRKNTTVCLIVQEEATRTHFHAVITSRKKLPEFRKDLRKEFPYLEGNKSYGLKDVKSQIGIEDYLCKGEHLGDLPKILERSPSWTDEKILQHHNSYWERHVPEEKANTLAKCGSDSIVRTLGKVKIRTPTCVEKVASKCRNFYGEDEISGWKYHDEIVRKKVLKILLEYLRDLGKTLDIIVLKRLYFGVLHQLLPQQSDVHWEDTLVRFLDSDRP